MLKKQIILVLMAVVIMLSSFLFATETKAENNLTDQQFFGVWNGSSWTTTPLLDYSYNGGVLSAVETQVKAGNYSQAEAALLTYYQNRNSRTVPGITEGNRNIADLACDLTFIGPQSDYLIDTITLNTNYTTMSVDVLSEVNKVLGETNALGMMLMGKDKLTHSAQFYSKEQATNKPRIEVTINGQGYTVYADKDTYIRGNYDTNYGTETLIYVREEGIPYNNNEHRGYITFDLSSLPQNYEATSATMRLYGKKGTGSGSMDINVFYMGNTAFTESGITWNNTLGNIYSWQGAEGGCTWDAPDYSDPEYLNVICRFGYASPMVYEYIQDNNETYYSGKLLEIMMDFLTDETAGYNRTLECGERSSSWVTSYHYLRNCSSMTSNTSTEILKFMWQQADFLADPDNFSRAGNWGMKETKGLYYIAVYFPEFTKSSTWKSIADTRFSFMLTNNINPDYSFAEHTSAYSLGYSRYCATVREMAELNGFSLSTVFEDYHNNHSYFAMESTLPNGMDPTYGDSDYADAKPALYYVGSVIDDDYLKYVGSGGTEGTVPDHESVFYPYGNLMLMRTGWDEDSLYMHFNNDISLPHAHTDLLSTIVYGHGRPLLVDVGRYNYDYDDPITKWLRNYVEAHNTIEIDDSTAMQLGCSVKEVPYWKSNDGFDFAEAYNNAYENFIIKRNVFFIKPYYWIVSDKIVPTAGEHKYEQTWHYLPNANISINGNTDKVSTDFSEGANIQVVPADPGSITATVQDGYYSTAYGIVQEAEYASLVKNVSGNVTFDTILYPTEEGDNRNVTVTRLSTTPSAATDVATALCINSDDGANGHLCYYYMSHESDPSTTRSFGSHSFDGKMAYIRWSSGGALRQASVVDGKTLSCSSIGNIISCISKISDIDVRWSITGTTLDIYGSSLKASQSTTYGIPIYASQATTVRLNGTIVSFTRVGNYIYAVESEAQTFVAYEEAPRTNAVASSTLENWPASNVRDSDAGTCWSTPEQSETGSQWIYIDMGQNYSVSKIKMLPRDSGGSAQCFPRDFKLQYSTNGTSWTDISEFSFTEYPKPINTNGEEFILYTPVTARYIRVLATKFGIDGFDDYYFQLAELQAYYTATQKSRCYAEASSVLSSGWSEENIIDNDFTSSWSSALQESETGNEWITIDMGGICSVTKIKLVPRNSGGAECFPKDFKFQYSLNGINYYDISGQSYTDYSVPSTILGEWFTLGSALDARYIRLVGTKFRADKGYGNYYLQMAEMFAY